MTMAMEKIGRPKRDGARYPSGKLKPYRAETSPALVRRMLDAARTGAGDPLLATPVGWLLLHGVLNDVQVSAAMEYGRIRARYDRAIDAPSRTSASPSYGAAYGAWEGSISPHEAERRAKEAFRDFHEIERVLAPFRATGRQRSELLALLDRTCVENVHPTAWELTALCGALSRLALLFKLTADFRKR